MAELKTLRICKFEELPSILDRDKNYIYFACDRLFLFFGQDQYYDPFVICEKIPDDPIDGYLYIQFDGTVKSAIKDEVLDIATIEDSSQLDLLKKLGTTYFMKADKRYIDPQSRTLQLPYYNGTYSMTADVAKDLRIDNDTVVRYDEVLGRFYIEGDFATEHAMDGYKPVDTPTVHLDIAGHAMRAEVKISENPNNILERTGTGLFAEVKDKVDLTQFKETIATFERYRNSSEVILNQAKRLINNNNPDIPNDSIYSMVVKAVNNYNSKMSQMISYYNNIAKELEDIRSESQSYTDKKYLEVYNQIQSLVNQKLK
jgi:hypothetical protein